MTVTIHMGTHKLGDFFAHPAFMLWMVWGAGFLWYFKGLNIRVVHYCLHFWAGQDWLGHLYGDPPDFCSLSISIKEIMESLLTIGAPLHGWAWWSLLASPADSCCGPAVDCLFLLHGPLARSLLVPSGETWIQHPNSLAVSCHRFSTISGFGGLLALGSRVFTFPP